MRFLLLSFWTSRGWLAIAYTLLSVCVYSQDPKIYVHSVTTDVLKFNLSKGSYLEIPPWITYRNGVSNYYQSSFYTKSISGTFDLSHPIQKYIDWSDPENVRLDCYPAIWKNAYKEGIETEIAPWRKNYNGVFSAHSLFKPSLGNYTLAFSHGEQKNEQVWHNGGYQYYQNQIIAININQQNPETFSGYDSRGIYREHWESYYGFINGNISIQHIDQLTDRSNYIDLGPVLWPSYGLVNAEGEKASWGLRHPSSIIVDGFVYLFYMDTSGGTEEGERAGFKVARVSLDSTMVPTAYKTYFKGDWNTSLPDGFDKKRMLQFRDKKGAKSTRITDSFNGVRLSVAKVKGKDFYLGVEQNMDDGHSKVILRYSKDLVHWSEGFAEVQNDLHHDYHLGYPIFLDKTGKSNTIIDLNDFFVIGQNDINETIRVRIRLSEEQDLSDVKPGVFDIIKEYEKEEINTLYPIPADDRLTMNYHSNENHWVEIRDIQGNLKSKSHLDSDETEKQIDVSELENGIYVMIVLFKDHKATRTFSVQR